MSAVSRHPLFRLALFLCCVGLSAASARATSPPTITSFSPQSGPVGTSVMIDGTNFVPPLSVTFGGNVQAAGSFTSTQITVTVPSGAQTGVITVTASGGSVSTATAFTVGSGAAPAITSATTAHGVVNAAFSYQITASNNPTGYDATGLPAGLSVDKGTGVISGTPTAAGVFSVALSATNSVSTGTATLTLTVDGAVLTSTTITSVPCTIASNGQYVLAANLSSSQTSGNLIAVSASNASIDLQGHYIAGPVGNTSQTTVGFYAYERGNLTIENGTIAYCNVGVSIQGNATATTNNVDQRIDNLRVTYCNVYGIDLENAPSSNVSNCEISQIGTSGGSGAAAIYTVGAGVTIQANSVSNLIGAGTYCIHAAAGDFERANQMSSAAFGIANGIYQGNLAHGCTTAFSGGTDAGSNTHD